MTDAQAGWWNRPYRIVQTNLRLTDADLDPDALAAQVRDFGATAITFNVGGIYAFYPTDLTLQARNPLLDRDLTGEMLAAAHRVGLRMVGRFDLSKGTRIAYDAHPDWFVHNSDGAPQVYNGTYQACVNGGWANDYALRILEEALGRYALDGVFFNMTGYQPYDYAGRYHGICHCANCQTGFRTMFQRDLPRSERFDDPAYADYLLFKQRTGERASRRIYDTVKALRPATGVMGNEGGACDFIRLELQRAVSRPAPEWPHQAGERTRWAAARYPGKACAGASTNFLDYPWRFASETGAQHLLRFAQQVAGGAQVDYYLLGTFDQPNTGPLDAVHRYLLWHRKNEADLTGTRSLARVALYHSRATEVHAAATETAAQQVAGFRGAYRALLDGRIPFDYVSDERLLEAGDAGSLDRYDVIVLSNVACLSDGEAAILDAFVERGGVLLMTGETGRYDARGNRRDRIALNSAPIERIERGEDGLRTYFSAGGEDVVPGARLLHLDGWYFHAQPRADAEPMLAMLPPPKFGPPELCGLDAAVTNLPGLLLRRFGAGRSIHLPWLPDWTYARDGLPEHRELLLRFVRSAVSPTVRLTGAGAIELAVRGASDGKGTIVHLVNHAGRRDSLYDDPPATAGLRLGVAGAAGTAWALAAETMLTFGVPDAEGFAWLDLPPVRHFEVVRIDGTHGG